MDHVLQGVLPKFSASCTDRRQSVPLLVNNIDHKSYCGTVKADSRLERLPVILDMYGIAGCYLHGGTSFANESVHHYYMQVARIIFFILPTGE